MDSGTTTSTTGSRLLQATAASSYGKLLTIRIFYRLIFTKTVGIKQPMIFVIIFQFVNNNDKLVRYLWICQSRIN